MATDDISSAVRDLIDRHLPSMDHVQVLLRLSHQSDDARADDIARALGLQLVVVGDVLRDLATSGLLAHDAATGRYRFRDAAASVPGLHELGRLYDERPATLVRALYDRPATTLRSFSDAFRSRKP